MQPGHPSNYMPPCPECGAPPPWPHHTTSLWQCRGCRAVLLRERPAGGPEQGVARCSIAGADVRRYGEHFERSASRFDELVAIAADPERVLLAITEEVRDRIAGFEVCTVRPGVVVVDAATAEGRDIVLSPRSAREIYTDSRTVSLGMPEAPAADGGPALLAFENKGYRSVLLPAGTRLRLLGCWGYKSEPPRIQLNAEPPEPGPRFRSWTGLETLYVALQDVTPEG